MLPLRDNQLNPRVPVVTYTLVALNIIVFLWDRQWSLSWGALQGPGTVFSDLAMRPREVVYAVSSGAEDRFPLATLFTTMFIHGGLMHLLGNMLFLLAFGKSVENALGAFRFVLYYLFWGIAASLSHIFVDPGSVIPTIGASGAIGGVLGSYFLLFPSNKIEFVALPFIWWEFVVAAWVLLAMWFAWQILFPQEGVANWAHVGGFVAGMVTVLVMGGRQKVLQNMVIEVDDEF
ncbi:MAG: rhomboid family intramembrane serine protease [Fimbriimonadaceae bacterium]